MRVNEPVTTRETLVPENDVLVSSTDTGGRIRFANPAFVAISGFTVEELEGAPHNLVRHPHMPQAAFKDLWSAIKAGRPWEGLVKNRSKSGDFYWVRANVTPVVEDGKVTGYVSIRTRPEREEVAAAEAAYAELRQGSHRFALRDGELLPTGWRHNIAELAGSVTGRLVAAGAVTALAIGLVGWLGIAGMAATTAGLRTVHEERLQPALQLAEIRDLERDVLLQVALMPGEILSGTSITPRIEAVRANLAQVGTAWPAIKNRMHDAAEISLVDRLEAARQRFLREGLEPGLGIAERGDGLALRAHLRQALVPLFTPVSQLNLELSALQARGTAASNDAAQADYRRRLWMVPAAGLGGLVLLGGLGLLGYLGQRSHLHQLEAELVRISRGELQGRIPTPPAREFRHVVALLRALRARLAYAEQERAEMDRWAGEERSAAVREMAGKVEAEARTAVDSVASRATEMATQAEEVAGAADRLGENAAAAAQASGRALENTQAVAAATEELSASIREIATQTAHASEVVGRAVEGGRTAEATIASLAEAASRVNDVVHLIGDVAAKTNLLALNATIEAARAGDAGKGFAVVAGEVKQLAAQTARATEDISRQLTGIATATRAAVEAVTGMGESIGRISETAGAIAAAVEQQGAATQEIARNVAANGEEVREMAGRIDAVARDAMAAGMRAGHLRDGTGEVGESVRELRQGLMLVVRTSMAEADRRVEPRFPTSEACVVEVGGTRTESNLINLSAHGALLAGTTGMSAGMGGTLELPRHGVRISFEVREASMRGLHLRFLDAGLTPAWQQAFHSLTGQRFPQPAEVAA
ncbi:PAS domain S-box protein [Dankookia rubra]|uniref:PAS domain S-box protein n=1 Tax=Dankookia rubra TaxID=1442381 RepID=A0A4R5QJP8_9PROT|nr:methyl-accepting chemotaxis protein [Dankookia rubra]TDH63039.1 PAS domain S-box protein [Dankookia rubra]